MEGKEKSERKRWSERMRDGRAAGMGGVQMEAGNERGVLREGEDKQWRREG